MIRWMNKEITLLFSIIIADSVVRNKGCEICLSAEGGRGSANHIKVSVVRE